MHSLIVTFGIIGVLGVGAQWLAWRLRLPAIVLMLAAGILAGPLLGILDPVADFGDALGPLISLAVALILFEGGLTLDFAGLRDASTAVRRIVLVAAPLGWMLGTAAAHLIAGLSLPVAAVFGGLLVVTGPTVVLPILRQAKLAPRTSSILRWEAIVNDCVGALFAVLAYEFAATMIHSESIAGATGYLIFGVALAGFIGWAAGTGTAWAFKHALVPEFMKVPALLVIVIAIFGACNEILEESGLVAVTLMGVILGNSHLPSIAEIRRFKEYIAVLLVSGVFVILAATLDSSMLALLDWRILAFVIAMMLVVRPLSIWLGLIGTNITTNEKALIAWVGPRGVVAVAISGFFGTKLVELGYADGAALAPIAFALVFATVLIQGFSVGAVARRLGLVSTETPGVLIVGASNWSLLLARALQDLELPVLVADRNWTKLRRFRLQDTPVYYGEILSEAAEHTIDLARFGIIIAASENDSYNALVCTDFGPEFGRNNVFQLGRQKEGASDPYGLPVTIGGRMLFRSGATFEELEQRALEGWVFTRTRLTDEFSFDDYLEQRVEGTELLADLSKDGSVKLSTMNERPKGRSGDTLLSFAPAKAQGRPQANEPIDEPIDKDDDE